MSQHNKNKCRVINRRRSGYKLGPSAEVLSRLLTLTRISTNGWDDFWHRSIYSRAAARLYKQGKLERIEARRLWGGNSNRYAYRLIADQLGERINYTGDKITDAKFITRVIKEDK